MNKMAVRFTLWRPQLPAARPAELAVNDRLNPANPLENAKSFNYNFWNIRGFDEDHFTLKEFANRKVRSLSLSNSHSHSGNIFLFLPFPLSREHSLLGEVSLYGWSPVLQVWIQLL